MGENSHCPSVPAESTTQEDIKDITGPGGRCTNMVTKRLSFMKAKTAPKPLSPARDTQDPADRCLLPSITPLQP